MKSRRVTIGPGGGMVIPAELIRSLGVEAGDQVVMDLKDGNLRVRSLDAVIKRVQERVGQYVPDHISLVDELMADRRAEAAREVSRRPA